MKVMDIDHDVVMGHEFSAEVVELGDNTGNSRVGDLVVSMPVAFDPTGVHPIGYSNDYPGGYGELMVLSDLLAAQGAQRPVGPPRRAHRADGGRTPRRREVAGRRRAAPPSSSAAVRSAWR